MHQAGIKNVVASSGTSLSDDQIRLIQRLTLNIVVLFDGDDAGLNASLRGLVTILKME
jgi:DNA primase